MGRHAHGLLTASHDDLGVAVEDCLVPERDGAQARAAQLIDAPRGALDRDAGANRSLASRVLSLTGGEDLSHDDFGDALALDAGTLECRLDRHLAEFVRRQIRKRPVERADRRACRTNDDDVVCHSKTPM